MLKLATPFVDDMFACCESGYVLDSLDEEAHTLDIIETSANLEILFQFLHNPPPPYEEKVEKPKSPTSYTRIYTSFPEDAIPFPIIPTLLTLADKYSLSEALTTSLHSHLAAYTSVFPLRVYGYAVQLGLDDVAAKTSMYLLAPPLSSYSVEDLKVIPTADAYHKLVLLHDLRIKRLREILRGESIFPHGYGDCPRHSQKTVFLWERKKEDVVNLIEAGEKLFPVSPSIPHHHSV
ncbi:hypothetical protein QCA50_001575 [Cerrena zonata]|uniref:Uncharacterized protein n=1 Tax=Cerrena zonata TaxID=2478898 RepID=A0AAW0GXH1_9APHY